MSEDILNPSKMFDSTIRIQMLASLFTADLTYSQLKKVCQCADGAMSNHTDKLYKEGYISVNKAFVNKKPQTTYSITQKGRQEFIKFVQALNDAMEEGK